jgi:CRP-like cAMP-binding protein
MRKLDEIPSCESCLKENFLFKHLTKDENDTVSYVKNCNFFVRGDIIYHEGNRVSGIYCVNKGIIKHFKTGIDGKEQIVRFSKPGDIFGFRSLLSDEPACTTAKVIEDAGLCFIPSEQFIKLINENAAFSMAIMKMSCHELGDANQYILDIAQKNVRERLAEILALLHKNFGETPDGYLNISLTREELASFVGTATESVIRLLSEFKSDKLIEINRRKIKIIDIQKIKKISDVY